MDLQQFQYILKIAQVGNITKAAEELYMTQPALSRFLSKVEREEGITIFDRSTTPLSLTYAGERYVETVKQMVSLADRLRDELTEITAHKKGKLTIGIPPARAAGMLPVFLPAFLRRCPNVEVHTVEHNSRQLREDVTRGRVDFAILPLLEPLAEFRCQELFREELYLVAMKGVLPETATTRAAGSWNSRLSGTRSSFF